jgi:hypothetical protein
LDGHDEASAAYVVDECLQGEGACEVDPAEPVEAENEPVRVGVGGEQVEEAVFEGADGAEPEVFGFARRFVGFG